MKTIDEPRLETDLSYRFGYLTEFMGFDDGDIAAIHGAAEHLAPLVPGLVDAVYDQGAEWLPAFNAGQQPMLTVQDILSIGNHNRLSGQ